VSVLEKQGPTLTADIFFRTYYSSCRLSVRERISGTTRPVFANVSRVLPVAVARSSSGGDAIRHVLPVSWMTSCLHTMRRTVKPIPPPAANIEPGMGLTPMSYDCLVVIVNYTNTHYSPCVCCRSGHSDGPSHVGRQCRPVRLDVA